VRAARRAAATAATAVLFAALAAGCTTTLQLPAALAAERGVAPQGVTLYTLGDPWSGGLYKMEVGAFTAEALPQARLRTAGAVFPSGRRADLEFQLGLAEAGGARRTATCRYAHAERKSEFACSLHDGARNLEPLALLEVLLPGEGPGPLGTLVHHTGAGVRTLTLQRDASGQPGNFVFLDGETPVAALQLWGLRRLWWRAEASPEERWALVAATAMLGAEAHLHALGRDTGDALTLPLAR
jgi:hypothetical protein